MKKTIQMTKKGINAATTEIKNLKEAMAKQSAKTNHSCCNGRCACDMIKRAGSI